MSELFDFVSKLANEQYKIDRKMQSAQRAYDNMSPPDPDPDPEDEFYFEKEEREEPEEPDEPEWQEPEYK